MRCQPVQPHSPWAHTRSPQPAAATVAAARDTGMSLLNLAARQRMLSQRMVLQTVLAAGGSERQLHAARSSLALFDASQARLMDTPRQLDADSAQTITRLYHGPAGVGADIAAFAQQVGAVLDLAERHSPRVQQALDGLVARTDGVLDALNRATTAFDQISRKQSETLLRELARIVAAIGAVAREAGVVSRLNCRLMVPLAGCSARRVDEP